LYRTCRVAHAVHSEALLGDGLGTLARGSPLIPDDKRVDNSERLEQP
jgi:hypothetical protein